LFAIGATPKETQLFLDFQILDFGQKRALPPPTFFAISRHLEWAGPSKNAPIMSGIKF